MRMKDDLRAAISERLPRLRRFAAALAGTIAAGDDLVQDACERALRRSAELRDASKLDGWLYSIIRNLWIDETRSRRVRRHDDLEAAASVIGQDGEAVSESRITLQAVRRCLGDMSADHRAVLTLVCVDGFSYQQASLSAR
jgi:RNA polymerase sigma-70 factor (ECF subfamily)